MRQKTLWLRPNLCEAENVFLLILDVQIIWQGKICANFWRKNLLDMGLSATLLRNKIMLPKAIVHIMELTIIFMLMWGLWNNPVWVWLMVLIGEDRTHNFVFTLMWSWDTFLGTLGTLLRLLLRSLSLIRNLLPIFISKSWSLLVLMMVSIRGLNRLPLWKIEPILKRLYRILRFLWINFLLLREVGKFIRSNLFLFMFLRKNILFLSIGVWNCVVGSLLWWGNDDIILLPVQLLMESRILLRMSWGLIVIFGLIRKSIRLIRVSLLLWWIILGRGILFLLVFLNHCVMVHLRCLLRGLNQNKFPLLSPLLFLPIVRILRMFMVMSFTFRCSRQGLTFWIWLIRVSNLSVLLQNLIYTDEYRFVIGLYFLFILFFIFGL